MALDCEQSCQHESALNRQFIPSHESLQLGTILAHASLVILPALLVAGCQDGPEMLTITLTGVLAVLASPFSSCSGIAVTHRPKQ
jgi:hypothetical protein